MRTVKLLAAACGVLLFACQPTSEVEVPPQRPLFELLDADYTQVDFINQLEYDADFNIYTYRNFYNGGGVAMGDINNDGLMDLYFTANMQPNRLYLNKGDFKFEDITEQAGVSGTRAWSTGVSMADVNGDGLLDIYVCNSGDIKGDNKQNELFINQGDLTFKESAEAYQLADAGYSTHAAFFDYDKDGDLDMYLLNNSYQAIGSFNLRKNERPKRDPVGGDKLFRQDAGAEHPVFTDVSIEAGIYGSVIGFGLGVTVGDLNRDGWQDIFISNDFFERDYVYMNNGDGTFNESLEQRMRSISAASMGADMADINNDGYPEIFVTDMLPEPDSRIKTVTTFENWDRYQYGVQNDYHHQFIRNMLHLNNADGTFSEIGRLTGVHATDWSWGALMADYNNDGYKDIYVANGIYQDLTDQDYIQFISNEETVKSIVSGKDVDYKSLIDAIPSQRIPNYMFVNRAENGLSFSNEATSWGLDQPSHSNGSAYGDLDNDGDLDLVVNNVNMPSFIYRNRATDDLPDHHYLIIQLEGSPLNTQGIGAQILAITETDTIYQEQMPMRGFQSTVDSRLHLGLGKSSSVKNLTVTWNSGKVSSLSDIEANQVITVKESDAVVASVVLPSTTPTLFTDVSENYQLTFKHQENPYVDFNRDRLIFHMKSTEGPALTQADINNDGLMDLYIGGAKDTPGQFLIQQSSGLFEEFVPEIFQEDKVSEDVDAEFLDADGDGDIDLYVASGGSEFNEASSALKDRLYLNQGNNQWSKSSQFLPTVKFENTAAVSAADYDGDGDVDLFVGIRLKPNYYGLPVNSYILENDGQGNFSEVTASIAPALQAIGMITDGQWTDYDLDGDPDLVIVGDWMSVKVLENEQGKLIEVTAQMGLAEHTGWWSRLHISDLDQDGDPDFVIGNHGLNSRFKASVEKPVSLTVNDFDGNGSVEQIISVYNGDESYPLVLKHDLIAQMPELKKKYLKYQNYKEQTLQDIFEPEQLEGSVKLEANQLQSSILINNGDQPWELHPLPVRAQLAPTFGIVTYDFDQDGIVDILTGGNFYQSKPEVGRYDASYGSFLKGLGQHRFKSVPSNESGLHLQGAIRDIQVVNTAQGTRIIVARNNDSLVILDF